MHIILLFVSVIAAAASHQCLLQAGVRPALDAEAPSAAISEHRQTRKALAVESVKHWQSHKSAIAEIGKQIHPCPNRKRKSGSSVFRFGESREDEHPSTIGKSERYPSIQDYEVLAESLSGLVLNIFSKSSTGKGGLLLALEVPDPCSNDSFVEVDRSRCSSRYPCSLRLPMMVVKGNGNDTSTRFRTRVIAEDEDYETDMLEYDYIRLDYDGEVVVAEENFNAKVDAKSRQVTKTMKFSLDSVLAAGAMSVMPVVKQRSSSTSVSMRIRQPATKKPSTLVETTETSSNENAPGKSDSGATEADKMRFLDVELSSYRETLQWTAEWRKAEQPIAGCTLTYFEVVADQLFPGDVELEIQVNGTGHEILQDVLVTTRVSWAEAEVVFINSVLNESFGYFLDPKVIIHGLPLTAIKPENLLQFVVSNPTEWGYALESWAVMAETGFLTNKEAAERINKTLSTLRTLQTDPNQTAHGLFYPFYQLRSSTDMSDQFPFHTEFDELPCGDDALLYSSLLVVQGWLKSRGFDDEEKTCDTIRTNMDFSKCLRETHCGDGESQSGDKFWSVPLTFNAKTLQPNVHNWNVWADEGGVVSTIVGLSGAASSEQYASIVEEQQRYSPCASWEGITVGHAAFFNSIFTLPTRSMVGFGTLFESPYYHEFAVRSVLPSFRAFQKLKQQVPADYMGPSDAMSMSPKGHPEKSFGSYAYWPPNNMYNCKTGQVELENQCTWCKGIQYEGLNRTFDAIVPHGNMAAFLVSAMMERTQFSAWLEDTKKLITDASGVWKPGYGMEVMAPARRTPSGRNFSGSTEQGRGVWESLSHGFTILSMYEGLAAMSRRYELARKSGHKVHSFYNPPGYEPLSQFVNEVPGIRARINELLNVASRKESKVKSCGPSEFGPIPVQGSVEPSSTPVFVREQWSMTKVHVSMKTTIAQLKKQAISRLNRTIPSHSPSKFKLKIDSSDDSSALDESRTLESLNTSKGTLFHLQPTSLILRT